MQEKSLSRAALRAAFPHTIPVLTGFSMLGIAFGILMHTKGYGIGWSLMMSAVCFCGSMQFAAVPLLVSAFNPLQAFLLSVMVNARHLFYGIAMLEKYRGMGKARFFLVFMLCDETFSINGSIEPPPDVDPKRFYLTISLLDYLYWLLGTAVGNLLGGLYAFNTEGLDFVLTALFIVLLIEQLRRPENRVPAAVGITASVLSIVLFGKANMVIPAMVMIAVSFIGGRKRVCG